jgi:hypothetical protein
MNVTACMKHGNAQRLLYMNDAARVKMLGSDGTSNNDWKKFML